MTHHKGWPGGSAPGLEKPRQALEAAAMEDCELSGERCFPPNLYYIGVGKASQVEHGARRHPLVSMILGEK